MSNKTVIRGLGFLSCLFFLTWQVVASSIDAEVEAWVSDALKNVSSAQIPLYMDEDCVAYDRYIVEKTPESAKAAFLSCVRSLAVLYQLMQDTTGYQNGCKESSNHVVSLGTYVEVREHRLFSIICRLLKNKERLYDRDTAVSLVGKIKGLIRQK